MKKLYLLSGLLAAGIFAGCTKDDADVHAAVDDKMLDVTVHIDRTRTQYDGAGRIEWLAGDAIGVVAAPASAPAEPTDYYAEFAIGDDLSNPVFNGTVKALEGVADYTLYGIYPYNALTSKYDKKISGIGLTLPSVQRPSQHSYDGAADVMVAAPGPVTVSEGALEASFRFAHLFGFAKIAFDAPDYAEERVKRVTMTATGEAQDLAGDFRTDLTLAVDDPTNALIPASYTKVNKIVLSYDGSVKLSDLAAWFVINPGVYDVRIEVRTDAHILTFDRAGLNIGRARIAEPVVTFKGADRADETAVALDGAMWRHDFEESYQANQNYSQFFVGGGSVSGLTAELGSLSGMPRMEWTLSYGEGENNPDYTTYDNRRINRLSSTYIPVSDEVRLASEASFTGISTVHVHCGIYSYSNVSCDLRLFLVEQGVRRPVGSVQRLSSVSNYSGSVYVFEIGDPAASGALEIVWDGFPADAGSYSLYLCSVTVNQAPEIALEKEVVALKKTAATEGTIACSVAYAAGEPSVSTDAQWLTANYADGVIHYAATQNTDADERTARITVEATGLSTTSAVITVTQAGTASPVYTTYRMTVTPGDISPQPGTSYIDSDPFSVVAYDVDDASHTLVVDYLAATGVMVSGSYFTLKGASSGAGAVTCKDTLEKIKSISVKTSAYSTSYFRMYAGQKSSTMSLVTPVKTNTSTPYIYTYTPQDTDRFGFFQVMGASNSYYTAYIYSIEIVFEVEE